MKPLKKQSIKLVGLNPKQVLKALLQTPSPQNKSVSKKKSVRNK